MPATTTFAYLDALGGANPSLPSIEAVALTLSSRVNAGAPSVTLTSTVHLENIDIATAAN